MISLWRIFCLEVTALVRSWTALILLLASLGWLFAAKYLLVTDSTEEGAREMVVRYGLGGVFALLVVSVLSIATGCIASERGAKRLQLTQVRPVSPFAIAWGKFLALSAVARSRQSAALSSASLRRLVSRTYIFSSSGESCCPGAGIVHPLVPHTTVCPRSAASFCTAFLPSGSASLTRLIEFHQ